MIFCLIPFLALSFSAQSCDTLPFHPVHIIHSHYPYHSLRARKNICNSLKNQEKTIDIAEWVALPYGLSQKHQIPESEPILPEPNR